MLTMEQLAVLTRGRFLGGLAVKGKTPAGDLPTMRAEHGGPFLAFLPWAPELARPD